MASFRTEGLDHVAVAVADLDRSEGFYREVLGLERVIPEWDPPRVLASGGSGMALFPQGADFPGETPPHILHIAFRVDRGAFEAAQAELAERGDRDQLLRPRRRALDLLRGS
jgi:catechol 2,3-dioxygenase-like lactoylglutathione lyase family enzyme